MKTAPLPAHTDGCGRPAASAEFGFDEAKVARIAAAIADGSFRIDAEAIADRLLADAERLARQAACRRAAGALS